MSNKQKISFESEHKAFAYLFAGLITLCAFPVLAYHYATTLEGFAVLAIGGLLATDVVMWFSAHWSVKTRSAAMRVVSLMVKFLIASVAVSVAAVVILLMRVDRQTETMIRQQSEARKIEIETRAEAAAKLAQVKGGQAASREAMKMSETRGVEVATTETRSNLEKRIPAWFLDFGVYAIPPIVAILGALALTITATIIKKHEAEEEAGSRDPFNFPSLSSDKQPSGTKPVQAWRGGVLVEPSKEIRPN